MIVFQILDITKNCVINTDHVTFFIINVYSPHEMNGNLLIFNCIDVRLKLCSSATFYIFVWDKPCGWFWWKKTKQGCEIFFPQLSNLSQPVFFTWKPNPLGLGNCSVPNFCETGFRYFCSLFTGTLHEFVPYTKELFMLKKPKLLTREGFNVFTVRKKQKSFCEIASWKILRMC